MNKTILSASILALFLASASRADIGMQFVSVGNPGNPNDSSTGSLYGGVGYSYAIGKYEVTLNQYTEFLNAVADADPNGLYNSNMEGNLNIAGITRSGNAGSYAYSVIGSGDHPVTYVSILDAMRFANWVNNGQPTGAQNTSTTEGGAYTLSLGGLAPRNTGAQVWIPSENEWYKAAYYDPTIAGANQYWVYATRSKAEPDNVVGAGANQANYLKYLVDSNQEVFSVTQSVTYDGNQNYLTPVGAFTSSSNYYGTYDQNGNVWEWNDTVIGPDRGLRGSSWLDHRRLPSSYRDSGLVVDEASNNNIGFRLASVVPEPASTVLILVGGTLLARRRRRRSAGA